MKEIQSVQDRRNAKGKMVLSCMVVLLGGAVTLLIGAILVVIMLPMILGGRMEGILKEQLAEREIVATWTDFRVGWNGALKMQGVEGRHPGMNSGLKAQEVEIRVSLQSLWKMVFSDATTPTVERIRIDRSEVSIDLKAIQDEWHKETPSKTNATNNTSKQGRLAKIIREILASPPELELNQVQGHVFQGKELIGRVTLETSEFESRQGGWAFSMTGYSRLDHTRLPKPFRTQANWSATGELLPLQPLATIHLKGRQDAPLFAAQASTDVRAHIGAILLSLKGFSSSGIRVKVEDVALSLGSKEKPALEVLVKELSYDHKANNRSRRLRISQPTLTISPADLRALPKTLKGLKTFLPKNLLEEGKTVMLVKKRIPEEDEQEQEGPDAVEGLRIEEERIKPPATETIRQTWRNIVWMLGMIWPYNVTVQNLRLDVVLRRLTGDQKVTLVERLNGRANRGIFEAQGRSSEGKIKAVLVMVPGQISPVYLSADLTALQLEKIPGMPTSRSQLPNRGTSGTLSGKVNLSIRSYNGIDTIGALNPKINASTSFDWSDGSIDLVGVSDEPIDGIHLRGNLDLAVQLRRGAAQIVTQQLSYGPIKADLEVRLSGFPWDPVVRAKGALHEIECQRMFRNLPKALLGPYRYLEMEGKWSPSFEFKWPLRFPQKVSLVFDGYQGTCYITKLNALETAYPVVVFNPNGRFISAGAYDFPEMPLEYLRKKNDVRKAMRLSPVENPIRSLDSFVGEPIPQIIGQKFKKTWGPSSFPRPPEVDVELMIESGEQPERLRAPRDDSFSDVTWLNKPFVKQVVEGVTANEIFVGPGTTDYVPIRELPGYVAAAAYLSEEIDFYLNRPLAPGLIEKALRLNLERGRFQYGGSTVTQQLVKNLVLTRDKTLTRKFQEALVSWRITHVVPRNRVLELYLNCIEFAPNVYGIGPAAQYYFQKDARNLEPLEAIFLAMMKPAPYYGERIVRRGASPNFKYWHRRTASLLDRLFKYGYITEEQRDWGKTLRLKWHKGVYERLPEPIPPGEENDPNRTFDSIVRNILAGE